MKHKFSNRKELTDFSVDAKLIREESFWSSKATQLANVGKNTVNSLRSSHVVKEAAEIAIRHCMLKLLDPKGAFVKSLCKNKKIGFIVKAVVAKESYLMMVDRVAESSAAFVGKGFTTKPAYTLPPESILAIAETKEKKEALPSPVTKTAQWSAFMSATTDVTTLSYKGKAVNRSSINL